MPLKRALKSLLKVLPKQTRFYAEQNLRWLSRRNEAKTYLGDGQVCPCCGQHWREFAPAGKPPRPGETCLRCGAGKRQRLMAIFLSKELKRNTKLLHFAPEVSLTKTITKTANLEYVSIDIAPDAALMQGDIQGLPFPDEEFDAIVCSHVLEHVPDDKKAMSELHRVLKPTGTAYVMVPQDFDREGTYEDPTITDPREREKAFGQDDHVRLYGRDFTHRLHNAGFKVETKTTKEIADEQAILTYGLTDDVIYLCRKA